MCVILRGPGLASKSVKVCGPLGPLGPLTAGSRADGQSCNMSTMSVVSHGVVPDHCLRDTPVGAEAQKENGGM